MPLDPIGWTVHRLGAVDSTMTPAQASARNGISDRTVFLAREQIGGHGRHGRPWYSPPGNLYFTAVLCPDLTPRRAGECSLLMSVVLAEALGALIPGADLVLIDDCGHLSTMERPEAVNAALREWLSR